MKPKYIIDLSKPWNRYPLSQRSFHFEELKDEVVSIFNKNLPKLKKTLNKDAFEILCRLINTLAKSKNPEDFENNWFPIHMFTGKENILLKFK
jgi:hypothetical protein